MSKWGSYLQNAVGGLEKGLDKILSDDDQASVKQRAAEAAAKEKAQNEAASLAAQPKLEPGMSRDSSRARPNSRLQDRLAAITKGDTRSPSRTSLDLPSGTQSPTITPDTSRVSIDSRTSEVLGDTKSRNLEEKATDDTTKSQTPFEQSLRSAATVDEDTHASATTAARTSLESTRKSIEQPTISTQPSYRLSLEHTGPPTPSIEIEHVLDEPPRPKSPAALQAELAALQDAHSQELTENRNEIHAHLERIDALQSKLNYLSNQLASAAKATADAAVPSSPEKKLAERDEKIAALLEEGQNLSKKELQHSGLIKKLRLKIGENDRDIAELKRRAVKAEHDSIVERERARRAEANESAAQEKLKIVARIEKDVDELRREKETHGITIAELRRQLSDSITRAEQVERKAQTGALEAERKITAELREEIADAKIEKKLIEGRLKGEIQKAKEEAVRQSERAKVTELELMSEISNLETKLEVLRTRTEEVSTSGDSQAKLLRQIETLQTQYALASENWQGIENTLASRVAALEKERDDIAKRENDVRRKARDVNSKARKLEDELETVTDRSRALENDLLSQKTDIEKLQNKATSAETALRDAQTSFEQQRKLWETEFLQKFEEEKRKWKAEYAANSVVQTPTTESHLHYPNFRAESPNTSMRKASHIELAGLGLGMGSIHGRRTMTRNNTPSAIDALLSPTSERDRPLSRRSLNHPGPGRSEVGGPYRQDSTTSLSAMNGNGAGGSRTPSIHAMADDDQFDRVSSPHRTVNDVFSASTSGAGPSVQLVERMSAAVRRLESEKASLKEEFARLSSQRDEARDEVVALMKEVEEKRALSEKVTSLEGRLEEVNGRYQTTLEMLGEKSERVEELELDVRELKDMYKELVQQKTR